MRQLAAQECQAEKQKMKEWKNNFMQEMARELHIMQQPYGEEIEAQRQDFKIESE